LRAGSHRPRKRFGQHFLHDAGVVRRIIEAIAPAADDFIVEIGPGEGVLTRPLAERAGRLEVIEIDRDLAAALAAERIKVHVADALEFDFGQLPQGARIVGNLPYNISTPLLFHLARFTERLRDLHFMLQREVVERMVAQPSTPAYGRLSVMLQARFRMEKLFRRAAGPGRGAFRRRRAPGVQRPPQDAAQCARPAGGGIRGARHQPPAAAREPVPGRLRADCAAHHFARLLRTGKRAEYNPLAHSEEEAKR
jgi:hypothetical protein